LMYKVLTANQYAVDSDFLHRLKNNNMQLASGNMMRLHELKCLVEAFVAEGLTAVPYKGVFLSQLLYGDFITRETVDIDIIILKDQFVAAHQLLTRLGYASRYYNPDFKQHILNTSHELQYAKTTERGNVKVELHWAATSHMMDIPLDMGGMMGTLGAANLHGHSLPTFQVQDHLLLLLIHHGVNDVWRTLRHLMDIALLLKNHSGVLDMNLLQKQAHACRMEYSAAIGFNMVNELLGIPLPASFSLVVIPGSIKDNLLQFPPLKKSKLNADSLKQQLLLRDSLPHRLRLLGKYLKVAIQPNIRDMEAFPLPKGLYYLYYILKPFRLLKPKLGQ